MIAKRRMHAYIYFYSAGWDTSPHGSLDFVFHNHANALDLDMEIRWTDEAARRRLFDVARRHESLFIRFVENPGTRLNPKLYRRAFLTPKSYEEASDCQPRWCQLFLGTYRLFDRHVALHVSLSLRPKGNGVPHFS